MSKRYGSALIAVAAMAISAQLPANAAGPPGTISISPSRTYGKAVKGRPYGPITLTNSTANPLRVEVIPVLLKQDRSGAIFVDAAPASLKLATRAVKPQVRRFVLPSGGGARSVQALLTRVPAQGSFYGGLLFSSQPTTKGDVRIRQVFRINGSLYLDPTARRARVLYGGEPMRAEQAAPRVLSLITPIVDRGNWALKVSGQVQVIDSAGRVRYTHRLASADVILPQAVVELRDRLAQPVLEPGVYQLRGLWRTSTGKRFRTSGTMRLFGPNAVETHGATVTGLTTGTAYIDEPVDVHVKFRNTGNVPFAPLVRVVVRPLGQSARPFSERSVQPERVAAGGEGAVDTQAKTPRGRRAYELSIRLFDGDRLLGERTLSLLPQKKPSLWSRFGTWIKDNAILVVLILLVALVAMLAYALWSRRRPREPAAVTPVAAPSVASPTPAAPPSAQAFEPPATAAPTQPATPAAGRSAAALSAAPIAPGATADRRVNLNTAAIEELMRLPGVGRRAAERIVAHREANGPFSSFQDLGAVEGFHTERIQRIAESAEV